MPTLHTQNINHGINKLLIEFLDSFGVSSKTHDEYVRINLEIIDRQDLILR